MKQENIYKITPIFISVFVFCFAIAFYALGWTEPTVAPPGGTVDVPLNVGNIGQSKAGGLILNTGGAANGLIVQNGKVGIGTTTPAYVLDVRGTSSPLLGLSGGALQVNAVPPAGQTAPVDAIKILGPNSPMNSNSSQNLKWSFSAAGSSLIRSYRGGSWDTYLQFLTNSSSAGGDNPQVRMTINGDGRVGVNTTTPNVNYGSYLDVNGALHWGTASLRGFLLVDGGSSIELGGSGTPYIDISNDNSATGVNDYDVRLILENDNLLRIAGGDVCLDATYGSKCLSTAGSGAPTIRNFPTDIPSDPPIAADFYGSGTTIIDTTPIGGANWDACMISGSKSFDSTINNGPDNCVTYKNATGVWKVYSYSERDYEYCRVVCFKW